MEPTATITCVECGGTAHLASYAAPDEPAQAGDIVAYVCDECGHRLDVELAEEEEELETGMFGP